MRNFKLLNEIYNLNKNSIHPVKLWVNNVPTVEDQALQQLEKLSSLPFIHKHIAVMPDVHAGKGSTIGSVIPTYNAIIPAAVGVDLGCFTGDTLIPTLDGNSYPIKDLTKQESVFVFSCSENGKIIATEAKAKKTQTNASLVEVLLDNNKKIRCTPDHLFLMRDGKYKKAEELSQNDALMPFYSRLDKDGYSIIKQPYSGKEQRTHWIVGRSGLMGEIPSFLNETTIIHHCDFNKTNNLPNNLQFMGNKEHSSFHAKIVENNKHWQSKDFEEKRIKTLRDKAKTIEGYKYYSDRGTKNITNYMHNRPEHFKLSVKDNGMRGKEYLIAYNKSEKGRAKSKEISNRYYECDNCKQLIRSPIGLYNHQKKCKNNHKVKSIKFLTKKEDVYCLTVNHDFHNFALDAGVFVHNCGMIAVKTELTSQDLPDNLKLLRDYIEQNVPHGRSDNGGLNDCGSWESEKQPDFILNWWKAQLNDQFKQICEKHPKIAKSNNVNHLGTLGTGNHFIEICLDTEDSVWIMLHSGSRGVGGRIGSYFISLAKEEMKRWFINLPDQDLSYLAEGSEYFNDYIQAVSWAQRFAFINRQIMMQQTHDALEKFLKREIKTEDKAVNCHHNYVQKEYHYGKNVWLTRKGAVSAKQGELGIIPGSMGAKSYIVRGKGNKDSFNSCSHGAGRLMSRTQAKKTFSIKEHEKATYGVECKKDESVIDETPMAYKNIDQVMKSQEDLVEVVYTLKQILCVKG